MGLRDIRVESIDEDDGADLTLEARMGESLEILARGVDAGGANAIATETVREEDVLAFQCDDADVSLFPRENIENQKTDVLGMLRKMGYNLPTTKVPEGHTYTLSRSDSASNATVLYREGSPTEFQRTDPGGPDNPTRVFISLGEDDSALSAAGTATEVEVETSTNPGALSGFPYEEPAPSGFEFDLIAVAIASDDSDGANTPVIDDFRLETQEEDFLARSNDNVRAELAQYPSGDLTTHPFVFTDPPTIEPGQELDVFVTKNAASGTDVQAATALVFNRRTIA